MKRILCAAVILLLEGCASRSADVISTPAPPPAPAQTPEAAPTCQPGQTAETAAGEYTAIQLQQQDTRSGQLLAQDGLATDGYYTMCMDGKWGLMKSDGTVLNAAPTAVCAGIFSAYRPRWMMRSAAAMRRRSPQKMPVHSAPVSMTGRVIHGHTTSTPAVYVKAPA